MRFVACATALLLTVATAADAAPDPYKPLQVYAGRWSVVTSKNKVVTVLNSCTRTGLFFVCEQSIDGAPKALVVFLPREATAGGGRYRTQTLSSSGAAPGPWFSLAIKDSEWIYSPEGEEPDECTLNHVVDEDHIHFDVQKKSGETWTTTLSGDETRVK